MAESAEKFDDLGLGTKANSSSIRSLNKDGSFNLKKKNVPLSERVNFYHSLVTMSWTKFFVLLLSAYIVVNFLFAAVYMLIGVEHLTGVEGTTDFDKFLEAFFFSSQTLTTLGYGRIAPVGALASTVAAIESMLGLLAFALATGMLYGRFSKPTAKIKYSRHAVISPYKGINAFMFRVVNPRDNELIEVEVSVTLSLQRKDSSLRDFYLLDLERKKVIFLPMTWTVVHPISDSSPLHNLSKEDMMEKGAEFIVLMKSFDETFSQTVYSRSSYKSDEIIWGAKFVYAMGQEDKKLTVDIGKIDETEKAELNRSAVQG
ncbi:MAG TPA: ion channel [Bacteroidia bacterium]